MIRKAREMKVWRSLLCILLAFIIAFGGLPALIGFPMDNVEAAEDEEITFERAGNQKPLFDGVPEHLDAFVDVVLSDLTVSNMADLSYTKGTTALTTAKGYSLPGKMDGGVDRVMGVSTDMPSGLALSQSWNRELAGKVGKVMGDERKGEVANNVPTTLMFSTVADLRTNPLSGRYEEGMGEDPVLSGSLLSMMANGIQGYGEEGNEDGFWVKTQLGTKHYTSYLAQWYRTTGQFYGSTRAIREYQNKSFTSLFEKGAVSAMMTTYGRVNGIPNHTSPNIVNALNVSPYSVYSVGDFMYADSQMTSGFNNGYQNYTDALGLQAFLLLSGNHMNSSSSNVTNITNAVNNQVYGITEADLRESVRPIIEMWVRAGWFNQEGAIPNGTTKSGNKYPENFLNMASNGTNRQTSASTASQEIALQAARESVVLLKNENGLLPLTKDKNVAVSGFMAETRYKAQYSLGTTPTLTGTRLTPLAAIQEAATGDVTFTSGNKVVAYKSKSTDRYVSTVSGTTGGNVTTAEIDDVNNLTDKEKFELVPLGQLAYGIKSVESNKYLTAPTSNGGAVQNNNTTVLPGGAGGNTNPPRLRKDKNTDGTVTFTANPYSESFGGGFETTYYNSRFLTVNSNNLTAASSTIGSIANHNNKTNDVKFEEITLKEAGADVPKDKDIAIVVIGSPSKNSCGEGADRSHLEVGEEQYELVENVAKAYPKKTIVIVNANYPVNVDRIQKDENVGAILYQPYAGQYDHKAMADVIYGDYAPTGRLSATWYADMEDFPKINAYSTPEAASPVAVTALDPRFTVDMSNGDPIDANLTYMYTDANITYPFGYGLSYSKFEYSDLQVPATANGKGLIDVSVKVKNTGTIETSEVAQLYMSNTESAYNEKTPKKKLVAFEKVSIAPGETKTITFKVDPEDFAVWDVNSNQYVSETGTYKVMAGSSSKDTDLLTQMLNYSDKSISTRQVGYGAFNVFDSAYATNEVVYREVSKLRTATGMLDNKSVNGYHAVMSKGEGSWVAIPKVDLTKFSMSDKVVASVATNKEAGTIELWLDAPNLESGGMIIGTIQVPVKGSVTRTVPKTGSASVQDIVELEYEDVEAGMITFSANEPKDLYLVFEKADLRIDSLDFQIEGVGTKEELQALVTDAKGLDSSKYTAESWSVVSEAVAKAEAKLAGGAELSKTEIVELIVELQSAIDSLELKDSGGKTLEEIEKELEKVRKEALEAATKAQEDANAAKEKADNAQKAAETAQATADQAVSDAKDAADAADLAQTAADKAQADAAKALQDAYNAQQAANNVQGDATQALQDAYNAQQAANAAQTTANNAQTAANNAKAAADAAQGTANNAVAAAGLAQTAANNAQTAADTAQGAANNAKTAADAAQSTANDAATAAGLAQTAASNAKTAADAAKSAADNAQEAADAAQDAADNAQQTANSALITANDAQEAAEYAVTTAVNALKVANAAKSIAERAETNAAEAKKAAEEAKAAVEEARKLAEEALEAAKTAKAAQEALNKKVAELNTVNADILALKNAAAKDAEAIALTNRTVKISSAKNKKKGQVTVALKKDAKAAGYQIQISLKKDFSSKKITKSTTKTSYNMKGLKKKTYYVRARAYTTTSKNIKVYGQWSKIKKVIVKK